MSKSKRKRYAAEFKAKVALEAIKGEATVSELATRFGIHPNLVMQWKRQAAEGMVDVFSGKAGRHETDQEARIKDLHAFETGSEAKAGVQRWVEFYNQHRPHSSLDDKASHEAYWQKTRAGYPGFTAPVVVA